MDKFIKSYPKAAFYMFSISLSVIGGLSLIILQNNTSAMRDLKDAIHEAVVISQQNKADIANHSGRIEAIERIIH